MSIVPATTEELEERISLQRIVRPTLYFNTDAPKKMKEKGIDQVRIISPNIISFEQIDEIDTTYLPDIKKAWLSSIDRQVPPAHLIDLPAETLEEAIHAILDPSLKRPDFRQEQRIHAENMTAAIPSEYTVSLPDQDKLRKEVIRVFIPFKKLFEMITRIDQNTDIRLRAVDIWSTKPPALMALQAALG